MKPRVLAAIRRRPGKTAQAACAGRHHSGNTRRSTPWRTLAQEIYQALADFREGRLA
jgi:hypothetical protein